MSSRSARWTHRRFAADRVKIRRWQASISWHKFICPREIAIAVLDDGVEIESPRQGSEENIHMALGAKNPFSDEQTVYKAVDPGLGRRLGARRILRALPPWRV
jgi:hypothetical protein